MYERTTDNNVTYKSAQSAENARVNQAVDVHSNTFLCKVYGYMAIAIAITMAVAYGVGFGLQYLLTRPEYSEQGWMIALIGLIVATVGTLVVSIIISFACVRHEANITVPAILYCIFFGVIFGFIVPLCNEVSPWVIPSALAITAGVFGILYFIGRKAKNLNWAASLGVALAVGALGLLLVFMPLYILANVGILTGNGFAGMALATSILLYMGIDALIFLAMMLFIMFDVWRIQKIADEGMYSSNLAMFCAFILYQDFMYVLMKVIRILLYVFAKSKN